MKGINVTLLYDTNALLNLQDKAFEEEFIISQKTLEEIENIKTSSGKDGEIKWKARRVAHLLDDRFDSYHVVATNSEIREILQKFCIDESPDSIICSAAYHINSTVQPVLFVTDDVNCKFIARKIFGLETRGVNEIKLITSIDSYLGYKDIVMTDTEMAEFYMHQDNNKFNLNINEYLIIRDSSGEAVDYRRWDGECNQVLNYKKIKSQFLGMIRPVNPQQVCAFDMLQSKTAKIKVLAGRAGSGKDYLMISNAIKMIEDGKFDKLVYIRNPIGVKDSKEIGFLPGNKDEKLMPWAMVLADHLGGETGLSMKMMAGQIEIEHLGYIRGRCFKNSIIYCTEAENLSREHVQLIISRVGEGSELWMNGDFKQTDSPVFRMSNGLLSTVTRFAGLEDFGYVYLDKTERSHIAALADLLD